MQGKIGSFCKCTNLYLQKLQKRVANWKKYSIHNGIAAPDFFFNANPADRYGHGLKTN